MTTNNKGKTMKTITYMSSLLLSSVLLFGCGGGSDSDEPSTTIDIQQTSVIDIQTLSGLSVKEQSQRDIFPTIKVNGDATINWQIVDKPDGFPNMPLSFDTTLSVSEGKVSFKSPNVDQDTELTLRLTVSVTEPETTKTADIRIKILASKEIVISGAVVDKEIPFADVTIQVGEQTFTVRADGNGRYSINVEFQDEDIVALATGIASDETPEKFQSVEFKSYLGDGKTIISDAGDDGVLSPIENINANISNVTTAVYTLVKNELETQVSNPDEVELSQSELNNLVDSIDEEETLKLAAIIQLVVDYGAELPAGIDSVLQLAESLSKDEAASETFVDDSIQAINENTTEQIASLDDVIDGIKTDTRLIEVPAIVGSWADENATVVLTFTDTGHYIHMEENQDGCGSDGYEIGTYSWSEDTKKLTYTTNEDTNGCIGLRDEQEMNTEIVSAFTLDITGNILTITEGDEVFTFNKLENADNPLIGAFYDGDITSSNFWLTAFINDTKFMELNHDLDSDSQDSDKIGLNAGTYSYDKDSSSILFTDLTVNQIDDIDINDDTVLIAVDGDYLIWSDGYEVNDIDSGLMRRTHNTVEAISLTQSDVIGKFINTDAEGGSVSVSLYADGVGVTDINSQLVSFGWRMELGQLVLEYDGLTIYSLVTVKGAESTSFSNYLFDHNKLSYESYTETWTPDTSASFDATTLAGVYEVVGAGTDDFAGTHQYTFKEDGSVDIVYEDGGTDSESWSVNIDGQLVFSGSIADIFTLTSGSQLSGNMELVIDDADGTAVLNTMGTITYISALP